MKLESETTIPAPRQAVWDALNDESLLIQCIPGCETLQRISDNELAGSVTAKLGSIKATLKGEVRLENVNPPYSYTLVGQGKGATGFARGRADVALHENGSDNTTLSYSVETSVGGKLAQLGGRLIDQTARKYADQFFTCFSDRVVEQAAKAAAPAEGEETPVKAEQPAEEAPATASSEPQAAGADPRKGLHPAIWATILILLVLGLLYATAG